MQLKSETIGESIGQQKTLFYIIIISSLSFLSNVLYQLIFFS